MDSIKKQHVPIIVGILSTTIICVGVSVFISLFGQYQRLSQEFTKVEGNIESANNLINADDSAMGVGRFIHQDHVVLAIDEITKAGKFYDISFISINPKEMEKLENASYGRLPIEISAVSEYKQLGLFLGQLQKLKTSVIAVKKLDFEREERLLPLVKATLILEVYFQDG